MPYIDAIIFTKYVQDGDGDNVPAAIADVHAWAVANEEYLPWGAPYRYEDLTGRANVHQAILDNLAVFCAKLQVAVATATQFAGDSRIWTLGYWRRDDEGSILDHNWTDTLTAGERTQAVDYITANSAITAAQIQAAFDASDTRQQIAQKLRAFFKATPAAQLAEAQDEKTARDKRRCTARTKAGKPCRNYATYGTDPPRCASHGGRV
jgi:hypothetical protein